MEKRRRGRPRKKEGYVEFWCFVRAAMAMSAYDEARGNGQKHIVAVMHAVDSVRQCFPGMRISVSEVKRTLAAWRPEDSRTILRFERSTLSEEDAHRNRWALKQLAESQGKKGLILPALPSYDPGRNVASFTISFGAKPNFPRHNRKNPQG
jgi:hypothetical protein